MNCDMMIIMLLIFYLLNSLVDSIVSVFFGFLPCIFYSLAYSFIILLLIYLLLRGPQVY